METNYIQIIYRMDTNWIQKVNKMDIGNSRCKQTACQIVAFLKFTPIQSVI